MMNFGKNRAKLTTEELFEFTEVLAQRYNEVLKSETFTLHKLKEIWVYMSENYKNSKKITKSIKKANKISEFLNAVNSLPEITE